MQQHETSAEESSEDDTTETARVASQPLVSQVVPGVAQSSGALPLHPFDVALTLSTVEPLSKKPRWLEPGWS